MPPCLRGVLGHLTKLPLSPAFIGVNGDYREYRGEEEAIWEGFGLYGAINGRFREKGLNMIPVRPTQWFPLPTPSLWCGVVVGCFPPPRGVVGSGRGSAWGGSPRPPPSPPCGMVRVRVFLRWFPLFFKSALGVWYTHPYDDNDENSDDDHHHHHHHPHH